MAPIVSTLKARQQGGFRTSDYPHSMLVGTSGDRPSLADRIAYAVDQSGKTLERLAEEIGCSHVAISNWQTGKTAEIKASLLLSFADATGFEYRWLITGEGPARSRYMLTESMDRVVEAMARIAREEPLQLDTVVRMVEAAASRRETEKH